MVPWTALAAGEARQKALKYEVNIICIEQFPFPEVFWLVVWNIVYLSTYGEFHDTDDFIVFRGAGIPPNSICMSLM